MVRLYDEREKDFEILGLEKVKKYLGEEFSNCKDAWEIDELLMEENDGLAGYRCEDVEGKPSYSLFAACANYEEAEKAIENYNGDGEVYISFN